jgi:thiol-disulfide isomerase/thioredoxin
MNQTPEQPNPLSNVPVQRGLAIASLVLGILALCLSFLLFGFLLGLIGLILGVVHLRQKRGSTAMAKWGLALSFLGLLASLAFGVLYFQAFRRIRATFASTNKTLTAWEGVAVPDFACTTLDGKKISFSELKGKRVILDFWATWCPPCKMEIPHFIRLVSETSRDDLIVIGISSEDEKTLRPFVEKNGMNYPVASADKLPEPFASIEAIPCAPVTPRRRSIWRGSPASIRRA